MGQFVGKNRVIAFRVLEALERRHLHPVVQHGIESPVAAMLDIDAGRREECLGAVDPLHGIKPGFDLGVILRGQAFNLLDIKNGVAAHERDFAFDLVAAVGVDLAARYLGGVNDKAALLALADAGIQFKRLLEGHPDRRGVAFGHRLRPQHQHIDSAVGNAIGAQRARDPPGGVFGIPRFEPRADSLLQFADDLSDNPLINIGLHFPSS